MFIILEIIVFVILFFKIYNLEKRINEMQNQSKLGQEGSVSQNVTSDMDSQNSDDQILNESDSKSKESQTLTSDFYNWFKEDWILKIGVLLVLIGFAWFISYAFMNNWLAPVGKIAFGFIVGSLVVVFGTYRMNKFVKQGGIFLTFGVMILMITIGSARFIYGYFDPILVVAFSVLISTYVAFIALTYNQKYISLLGLFTAFLAPVLTDSPKPDHLFLISYISLVSLAYLWINLYKNWKEVGIFSVLIFLLYSLQTGLLDSSVVSQEPIILLIGFLTAGLFLISNIVTIFSTNEKFNSEDLTFAVFNSALIVIWTLNKASIEWMSLILAFWVVVFALASFIIFMKTKSIEYFYTYSLISVAYLIWATAIEFDGPVLALVLIIESFIITLTSFLVTNKKEISQKFAFLMVIPAFLTLSSFNPSYWKLGFLHQHFVIILAMIISLLGLGLFFYVFEKKENMALKSGQVFKFHSGLIILGSIYLYSLIWLSVGSIYTKSVAVTISLTIYVLIGLATYLFGSRNERKVYKYYGVTIILLVVARLVLIDVWTMTLTGRIVAFILIGILFISTAFFRKNKTNSTIGSADSNNVIKSLLLVFVISSFLLQSGLTASANQPLIPPSTIDPNRTVFQGVIKIKDIDILVPAVVSLPIDNAILNQSQIAVFDETLSTFIPSAIINVNQENNPSKIILLSDEDSAGLNLSSLHDKDYETYFEFSFDQNKMSNQQIINIYFSQNKKTNTLNLNLDQYVALPDYIEITYLSSGNEWKTAFSRSEVKNRIINFPEIESKEIRVKFEYSQPLRITEIHLNDIRNQNSTKSQVRFLAKPNNSYEVYLSAERYVEIRTGESPDLFSNQDIKFLIESIPENNKLFVPSDRDIDGIIDQLDNCVTINNRDQLDINKNGRGDVCDDFDKDGILNYIDNCPENPNANQYDVDNDRKGDVCDGEESRLTEKYPILVWISLIFAGLVFLTLFLVAVKNLPKNK